MSESSRTGPLPRRPQPRERVLVIGDGPVARGLGRALERAGGPVERWSRKEARELPHGDVVVLAVRDEAIGDVAAQVMDRQASGETLPILLHCAGALPAEEPFRTLKTRPLGVGLLHPLKAFAGGESDADLAGTVFAVQGDEPGRDAAQRLVRRVGGTPLELDGEALARYHAAAVLVSNHAVGLVDAGVELLTQVGLDRADATRALAELLGSTVRNLLEVGLPRALTGPTARGDVEVIARHLLALKRSRELATLYKVTGRRVVKVSEAKGRAAKEALARIRALLVDGE